MRAQPAAGAVPGLGGHCRRQPHPLRQRGQSDRGGESLRDAARAAHLHRLPQVRLRLHARALRRWHDRRLSIFARVTLLHLYGLACIFQHTQALFLNSPN